MHLPPRISFSVELVAALDLPCLLCHGPTPIKSILVGQVLKRFYVGLQQADVGGSEPYGKSDFSADRVNSE